jgi:hypothetical protein
MLNLNKLLQKPFHVLFIASYPILFLYLVNITELPYGVYIKPVLISLAVVLVLFTVLLFIVKQLNKAGIATSFVVIFFYTYGHLQQLLKQNDIRGLELFGIKIGVNSYLLPLYASLVCYGLFRIYKCRGHFINSTICFNIISLLLVGMSTVNIFSHDFQNFKNKDSFDVIDVQFKAGVEKPDIYYILLDGYPRRDILKAYYQYDNTPFIKQLKDLKFKVLEAGSSNYTRTKYSVRSIFEMDYIDNHFRSLKSFDSENKFYGLNHANIFRIFNKNNYDLYSFKTSYLYTELVESPYTTGIYRSLPSLNSLSHFNVMLLKSTLLAVYFHYLDDLTNYKELDLAYRRKQLLFMLDTLDDCPKHRGPGFVFAHLICPHVPLVFDENGQVSKWQREWDDNFDSITPQEISYERFKVFADHSNAQITYLNKRIAQSVKNILRNSPKEPIIIIQSDHSDRIANFKLDLTDSLQFYNFTAIYMPERYRLNIPSDASSVNTFRYILNAMSDFDLPILSNNYYNYYKSDDTWMMEKLTDYNNNAINRSLK